MTQATGEVMAAVTQHLLNVRRVKGPHASRKVAEGASAYMDGDRDVAAKHMGRVLGALHEQGILAVTRGPGGMKIAYVELLDAKKAVALLDAFERLPRRSNAVHDAVIVLPEPKEEQVPGAYEQALGGAAEIAAEIAADPQAFCRKVADALLLVPALKAINASLQAQCDAANNEVRRLRALYDQAVTPTLDQERRERLLALGSA